MPPAADKHAQIVDAAVAEFRERGFQGASMDRIAERANVSKRTVYNHFESKEALFKAIVDQIFERIGEVLSIAYRPGQALPGQLRELGRAEGQLFMSEPFMALVRMIMGEQIRDPKLAAEMNEKQGRITCFGDFMRDAFDDGALSGGTPDEAAAQFMGLIKSRAFWPYVVSGDVVDAAAMETIVENAIDTFLARFAPKR